MCTFKHKVHNWLKQGEESLERESMRFSFGKKSHSSRSSSISDRSRSSNSSTKERAIAFNLNCRIESRCIICGKDACYRVWSRSFQNQRADGKSWSKGQGLSDDRSAVNKIRSWFDEKKELHNLVKSNRKRYLWWSTLSTTSTTPQPSK